MALIVEVLEEPRQRSGDAVDLGQEVLCESQPSSKACQRRSEGSSVVFL